MTDFLELSADRENFEDNDRKELKVETFKSGTD